MEEENKEELGGPEKIKGAIETIERSIEISPISNNVAICVVKPDAFNHRDAIIERLEKSGLYIVRRNTKNLPEQFVLKNYQNK